MMRLTEATLVLCLLFMACISTSAVARSSFVNPLDHRHHRERTVVEAAWSKFKSNGYRLFDYLFHSHSNNTVAGGNSGGGDSKRVVPTGPNPLHNR